mmetsp:Transcript_51271/g.137556  ORF Transcript_51271/g.137556 Transcript_51271/m.137556 type:complete len:136 (+) Transcript_51271:596-1003(+)
MWIVSVFLHSLSGRQGPLVLYYTAAVGLTTAIAVWATTHLIHEAGSVVQVGVSTLRKLLTIAISYLLFPKPFGRLQMASITLVAMGLLLPFLGFKRSSTKCRSARHQQPSVVPCGTAVAPAARLLGRESGVGLEP